MKVSFFKKNGVVHTLVSHVAKDGLPAYAVYKQPLNPVKAIRMFVKTLRSLR